jgi:hypothetical protein
MRRKDPKQQQAVRRGYQEAPTVPVVIAIGLLIEVWAQPSLNRQHPLCVPRYRSARNRYRTVRNSWASLYGPGAAGPVGEMWSAQDPGQHDPGSWAEVVASRLADVGCTIDDLPALQADADNLLTLAVAS